MYKTRECSFHCFGFKDLYSRRSGRSTRIPPTLQLPAGPARPQPGSAHGAPVPQPRAPPFLSDPSPPAAPFSPGAEASLHKTRAEPGRRRVPHSPCAPLPGPARSSAARCPAGPATGWRRRRPTHPRGRRQPSCRARRRLEPTSARPLPARYLTTGLYHCRGGEGKTTAAGERGELREHRCEQPGSLKGAADCTTAT